LNYTRIASAEKGSVELYDALRSVRTFPERPALSLLIRQLGDEIGCDWTTEKLDQVHASWMLIPELRLDEEACRTVAVHVPISDMGYTSSNFTHAGDCDARTSGWYYNLYLERVNHSALKQEGEVSHENRMPIARGHVQIRVFLLEEGSNASVLDGVDHMPWSTCHWRAAYTGLQLERYWRS
jgi:hypothetical protein